jgi:2-C-methyl-D-erythritol 4-phosphate cytidylyltransferase / 2-C-methyl-D-erythritol 2,4-cyclodiphosphate synthase
MRAAAVIVAAGQGTRAGTNELPKQYQPIDGQPMLRHSIDAFARHDEIVAIQVVIHPEHLAAYLAATGQCGAKLLPPVTGGTERQSSGLAGLEALQPHGIDVVLIHDAARPFVSAGIIERVLGDLKSRPASIAAVPLADTLKRQGADGSISGTIARDGLWRAQTPQGFDFAAILGAHRKAKAAGHLSFTDDASLAEWSGLSVGLVAGSESNRKMTTAEDMRAAQTAAANWPDFRSASGFDVHRFCAGDHVMLCGVRIPHNRGLEGHSDADAPLHALTDALLGCIGAGDIGLHFPPSDQRWKGASSEIFLTEAARLIRVRGGRVGNADVTILSESPRIGPYREAMRSRIAQLLNIAPDKASVKATTMEQLGSIGRSEGLAAMATATVVLPPASSTAVDGKT